MTHPPEFARGAVGPAMKVRIVFTDLDGTLLNSRRQLSPANRRCLTDLGRQGVVRVIATGRSLYSFRQVIRDDFPADYLIFSSGAGILDLKTDTLLHAANLESDDVARVTGHLLCQRLDFMVHQQVPDNHRFVYHGSGEGNDDFHRRIAIYREFATAYGHHATFPVPAAQVIAILPHAPPRVEELRQRLTDFQVIRTTSPLDHHSIWLEIMPHGTNKGSSAAWLCRHLAIDQRESAGIGNDYNDIDLLDFTPRSVMLANGPAELHHRYRLGSSHDEDGFARAVNEIVAGC